MRSSRRRLFLLAWLCAAALGCNKEPERKKPLMGNGVRAEKTGPVEPFTKLRVGGALDVHLLVGKDAPMHIEGDENLVGKVVAKLENGTLRLETSEPVRPKLPLRVRLEAARLDAAYVGSTGKLEAHGVRADQLDLRANLAARLTVDGNANNVTVSGKGPCQVDLTELSASSAVVRMEAGATARLGTLQKLDVAAAGPSRVYYRGEPELTQRLKPPAHLIPEQP